MPFPSYDLSEFPGSACNESRLHGEIVAAAIAEFGYVTRTGDTVEIVCDPEPSSADQATVDGIVAAHDGTPEPSLEDLYQLADHPTEEDVVILVDAAGDPLTGKVIQVGDAIIGGDSTHSQAKGPVVRSPNGTRWRLGATDAGEPTLTQLG